jgi:hypothetical protein
MPDIEKLIESTKFAIAEKFEYEFRVGTAEIVQSVLRQYADRQDKSETVIVNKRDVRTIEYRNKSFKESMEKILNDLKVELVRSIVKKEAPTKSKYEVVVLKVKSELIPIKPEQYLEEKQFGQMREIIDLQESDIPISYQVHSEPWRTGARSITELIVWEVVVLRPVAEAQQ